MAKFKTRARALDLLGRQQIAGIPTAINELIKNAHDAYSYNFDIDFIRRENLLVLRDDGLGMTKEEFENRWLTIGTESKFSNKRSSLPPIDTEQKTRPITGEKGIGRLAIASIGEQVLIITKAKNLELSDGEMRNPEGNIVVALINWKFFEIPNINLEDLAIPILELKFLPTKKEVDILRNELLQCALDLYNDDKIDEGDLSDLNTSISSSNIDPFQLNEKLVGEFNLEKNAGGTFFYISPVNETLIYDLEDSKFKEASKIEKLLNGFHNTMTQGHPMPVISINFRDYSGDDDTYVNVIDEDEFFTPDDFNLVDHQFSGEFDEYGQFNGTITVFKEKNYEHIVTWNGNNFKKTQCGPFKINFAYLQGDPKNTIVEKSDWTRLYQKGEKYGGLYIYKDNIRILPYGDSDYDFLDIEKNRSKRASTYFFSYRRMFGALELSSLENSNLSEKAGREGFIENKAYRQLQDILKNFFIQLAADFFDDKGRAAKSEFWFNRKEELLRNHKALEKREQASRSKKNKFSSDLDIFFYNHSEGIFISDINAILLEAKLKLESVVYFEDLDKSSQLLIEYENQFRQEINNYKKQIAISSPRGFVPTREQRKDYEAYLREFTLLERGLVKISLEEIDVIVSKITRDLNIEVDKRRRLELAVESISQLARKENSEKRKETQDTLREVSIRVKDFTSDLMIDLDDQILRVRDNFKHLSISSSSDIDLVEERKKMEEAIDLISTRNKSVMDKIIKQFTSFYIGKDEEGNVITEDDISNALSEELEELRERVQTDVELSQLGLAVGVLHHEFASTIKSIRSSLRDLRAWSDVNEKLENVYNNIKINFEHLDGYLNLFTPLNRRLNRRREDIPLLEIKTFLMDLFKSRMERHSIELIHTNGFRKNKIFGFRSTFYPVFVNLIDNAIHWLNQSDIERKIIRLHADEEGVYISNNGVEIDTRDKDRIFELGFSRKKINGVKGRGMGLKISKEVLETENYDIVIDLPRKDSTVTFKIMKLIANEK
ncbi:ATP-binding protein [Sphingobacterium siyangense]|uniref:ATP-binding protein n=1 Tax=Sphingobacterium siyangense TaxID=459529 RepID=UPI003DA3C42F